METDQLIEGLERCENAFHYHKCSRKTNRTNLSLVEIRRECLEKSSRRVDEMHFALCLAKQWEHTHRECVEGFFQCQISANFNQNIWTQSSRSTEIERLEQLVYQ